MSFFKIPIDKLTSKLPEKYGFTKLNPSQQGMVDGLDRYRNWVHISARRTGKSSAAAVIALAKLLEPNQQVIVVAPDYNLSSIIWDYTTELIEAFGIETKRFNLKDRVVKLVNDSTLRLLSANNRGSLVGRAANLIIVDEAALIDEDEYFTRDLRPALSTFPDSRVLFISTPRGTENYLYRYFMRGGDKAFPEWGSAIYDWTANPRLQESDILEAKRAMSHALFRQEYYCEWATFEGQIYPLNDDKHLIDLLTSEASFIVNPRDERFTFIAGLDVGFRDPTALVIIATDGEHYFVVDEYIAKERSTSFHASTIKSKLDYWGAESCYIDSAAQQTKSDLAFEHDILCENAVKSVNDGLTFIQGLIENDKLFFDVGNTKECYADMKSYRWLKGSNPPKPDHRNSHYPDALRYAVYTHHLNNSASIYTG